MSEYADALNSGLRSLTTFVVGGQTLGQTLDRVATVACEAIPGADVAGLTLFKDGKPTTSIYTDETSPEIDKAQYEADAGPCLDAIRSGDILRVDSTITDDRWPEFRKAALDHGIQSTLSLPLLVEGEPVGALNLYSRQEAAFPSEEAPAMAFASQAAVAVANARVYWEAKEVADHLREAMKSRAVIEQAKGILMAAQRCDDDEAFQMLVRASQRTNRKLREVAQDLVEKARQRRDQTPPERPS